MINSAPTVTAETGQARFAVGSSRGSHISPQRPRAGEVRVRVGALGLSALGVQAIGHIEAVGPEAAGFAPGDRVAYRLTALTPPFTKAPDLSHIIGERDLIGFPKDVAIEQAAALLPMGLIARTIVKHLHSIGRGNRVSVAVDDTGAHAFVIAWARYLGAEIVERNADVEITSADYTAARQLRTSHGIAQVAASEVFHAVRCGVFDGVEIARFPLSDAAGAKRSLSDGEAPIPVVLIAA